MLPEPEALEKARQLVGWQWISMDKNSTSITLKKQGMQLDLGGLAKGYILDRAMQSLKAHGISIALLEAGGEILVGDAPPDQEGWQVSVADAPASFTQKSMTLTNAAISTSGDTEQFLEINGIRYSHVVNPKTGVGLTHRYKATVIGQTSLLADGLATAFTLLDEEEVELLENTDGLIDYYLRKAK